MLPFAWSGTAAAPGAWPAAWLPLPGALPPWAAPAATAAGGPWAALPAAFASQVLLTDPPAATLAPQGLQQALAALQVNQNLSLLHALGTLQALQHLALQKQLLALGSETFGAAGLAGAPAPGGAGRCPLCGGALSGGGSDGPTDRGACTGSGSDGRPRGGPPGGLWPLRRDEGGRGSITYLRRDR